MPLQTWPRCDDEQHDAKPMFSLHLLLSGDQPCQVAAHCTLMSLMVSSCQGGWSITDHVISWPRH